MSTLTTAVRRLVVLVAVAAAGLGLFPGPAPTVATVPAATFSQFPAGNLISDGVFFDGGAMTAPEVQSFLDVKNPKCVNATDAVCLRVYRQDTPDKAADAYCGAYPGGRQESAADIIAKVGVVCGISQRVLLVMLQKEQSLVTDTASNGSLYPNRYRSAMGYGCPDTAACDSLYYGFFNQVYNAARKYQVYRANPRSYNFRAGITRDISYYPATATADNLNDVRCGTQSVYIHNQATAGLYNYTPYVPNASALAAGYGSGDACATYGNRNFWAYFTDWFGSTQEPGAGEVATRYAQSGGEAGVLGKPTSLIGCGLAEGGCYQYFANGAIHWSPSTGAFMTRGWIGNRWGDTGRENGFLGYPISDEGGAAGGGTYQAFQGGVVYSSSAGAQPIHGWIFDRWTALGKENGFLRYPTSGELGAQGGVGQYFQGGVVYSSPSTGAHEVHGWVLDKWSALGRESGVLGFPTSDEIPAGGGAYNTFSGGAVFSAPETGAHEVHGWIAARWLAAGGSSAAVGYPVSDEQPAGDGVGVFNEFSNGVVYSSPSTGAHDVVGVVAQKWLAMGGVSSILGYPTADPKTAPGGGSVSVFQGGWVYASDTAGAHEVHGWIGSLWSRQGGPAGALGWPTSDELPAPDGVGVYQTFRNGLVYSSPSAGAHEVHGLIEDKWTALGGLAGWLGVPVSDEITLPDTSGRAGVFSSGAAIYYSPSTGAFEVHGWIRDVYSALGGERGFLGYPTSDETPVPGMSAVVSTFQGGRVWSSAATGAQEVHGAVLGRYLELGGPSSALGLPVSNEYAVPGGRRSDFEHGTITYTTSTGSLTVTTR